MTALGFVASLQASKQGAIPIGIETWKEFDNFVRGIRGDACKMHT
jgi:hypothetical protein